MLNLLIVTLAETPTDLTTLYNTISIIGYSLAGICLVLSAAIFFLYDIRGAYSYLTGRKQQKGISEMRKHQGEDGEPVPASPSMKFGISGPPKPVSNKRHSATVSQPSAPPPPPQPPVAQDAGETAALNVQSPQEIAQSEESTGVLSPANTFEEEATGVLSPANEVDKKETGEEAPANDIDNSAPEAEETVESPAAEEGETSILSNDSPLGSFVLVKNEMVIHTDEVL